MKKFFVILGTIIILAGSYYAFNGISDAKIGLLEEYSAKEMDVDVALYPFSTGASGYIDGYQFLSSNTEIQKIDKEFDMGISSIVELDILEKLYNYYNINTYEELINLVGQYFFQYQNDTSSVLVFSDWYNENNMLRIFIIAGENISVISEELNNSDITPIFYKVYEDGILLLLKEHSNIISLRKVNINNNTVEKYSFTVEGNEDGWHSPIDMAYIDDQVYFIMALDDNISKLYTYNLNTELLISEEIIDREIDFLAADNESLCYGYLDGNNGLQLYLKNIKSNTIIQETIPLSNQIQNIIPYSAYYNKNLLTLNFTHFRSDQDAKNIGELYRFDLGDASIVNRYLYEHDGTVYTKYFAKDTGFEQNAGYSATY